MAELIIKGGTVVGGDGEARILDVLVENGRIAALGEKLLASAERVIDARGLYVLPGGVDGHVHLPWKGEGPTSCDTFAGGSRAAAWGGVTTIIDCVVPGPEEGLENALQRKLAEAHRESWVDYSFHLVVRGEVSPRLAEMPELVKAGFPSFKVFMAFEGFRLEDADLLRVLDAAAHAGGLVTVHAENGPLAEFHTRRLLESGRRSLADYPLARPAICEEEAVRRILDYQRETGARLHFHHISTAGGAAAITAARAEGRPVTAETCPHYLVYTQDDYVGDPTRAASLVCAPSIKSRAAQNALWQALIQGTLSGVASDHCPYTRAQKQAGQSGFWQAPAGLNGVEIRLPLLYTCGVDRGRLSLEQFVDIWAGGPARAYGLWPRKGQVAVGSDADLVLFDPQAVYTLRAKDLHGQSDDLAYEGMPVMGRAVGVILRGNLLVEGGRWVAAHPGGAWLFRG